MKRIGMAVATLAMTGGLLLAPSVGHACGGHGHAAPAQATAPAANKEGEPQAHSRHNPLEEVDELLTARCQCESKADCTCKKGQCECPKCKGSKRHVMDALRNEAPTPRVLDARKDASAGVFI